MASAFGAADADEGFEIEFAVTPRSLVIAYALGVLLTLVVVAVSAWRVSAMTIAAAIRNLPEPPPRAAAGAARARGRSGIALGALLDVLGRRARARATPLMLGVSLVLIGLVPLLRARAACPERLAYTACGLRDRRARAAARGASGRRSSARSRWTSRPGSSPG